MAIGDFDIHIRFSHDVRELWSYAYDPGMDRVGVTIDDVRDLACQLDRSYEVLVNAYQHKVDQ